MLEQLSKDCFIDALNDHDLEWAVLQGNPFSVEDALKLALEYEAFQRGRRGRYNEVQLFSTAPEWQEMGPETYRGNAQQATQSNQSTYSNRSEYKRAANGNGRRKQCNFCSCLGHDEVIVIKKIFRTIVPVTIVIHLDISYEIVR